MNQPNNITSDSDQIKQIEDALGMRQSDWPDEFAQIQAIIAAAVTEARIEKIENSTIPPHFYWNSAEGETMTVGERLQQLKAQLITLGRSVSGIRSTKDEYIELANRTRAIMEDEES